MAARGRREYRRRLRRVALFEDWKAAYLKDMTASLLLVEIQPLPYVESLSSVLKLVHCISRRYYTA